MELLPSMFSDQSPNIMKVLPFSGGKIIDANNQLIEFYENQADSYTYLTPNGGE